MAFGDRRKSAWKDAFRHPTRLVTLAFAVAIVLGTMALMLPAASADGHSAPMLAALFTTVSAICVTGLNVVDPATYWSGFGQAVILLMMQVGGLGIMTGATLLGLLVSRQLKLSTRLLAQTETPSLAFGDLVAVLKLVLFTNLVVEGAVALWLAARLHWAYAEAWPSALWNGLFHAVAAFNNAGFSSYTSNMMAFHGDAAMLMPVALAIIIGGLGFPVLHELFHERRRRHWSLHSKLTVFGTIGCLAFGTLAVVAAEWGNPGTFGSMAAGGKLLNAFFHVTNARTAGFNAVDVGQMASETLAITNVLMLIGGGSASTAGGIKVTTLVIIGLMVWAEVRSERDTTAFGRRIPAELQRQAVAVSALSVGIIGFAIVGLLVTTDLPLEPLAFEAVSAFSTTGLSTGITPKLPAAAQAILIALMFIGRIGIVTLATALALKSSHLPFRYPEERPIVG